MPTKAYPEHEKLEKVSAKSQACGEFIEWLMGRYEIAQYHEHTDACYGSKAYRRAHPDNNLCGYSEQRLEPVHVNIQKVLAEFYGINQKKLAAEKDTMLKEILTAAVAQKA